MRARRYLAGILLLLAAPIAASGQASQAGAPDTVVVPSGTLRLRALLWTPDGPGPFPAILFNPGAGCRISPAGAARAAGFVPTFVRHGYAVLTLFRRGDGLSADQGKCMGDLLRSEETANGPEARNRLQLVLLTTDHLTDVVAGLAFLRSQARVDAGRIGIAGHSFGGQLALLAAEQDTTIRAVVTFAAAAASWEGSPELRTRLLAATRKTTIPVMLVHAADDSSTAPAYTLASELSRLGKRHVLKILPDGGHGAVYTAIARWEPEVFRFLDGYVRGQCAGISPDSGWRRSGPVYQDCEVEPRAKRRGDEPRLDLDPVRLGSDSACKRVTFVFVVDTRGAVELASVRTTVSDHPELEAAVRATLPELKYAPAKRANQPVRQVVEYSRSVATPQVAKFPVKIINHPTDRFRPDPPRPALKGC